MPEHSLAPLTPRDVPSLVGVHRAGFAGYVHAALGDRYVADLLRWYASDPRTIGFVARSMDGSSTGLVFGTDDDGLRAASAALRIPAIRGVLRRPGLLVRGDLWRAALRRIGPRESDATARPADQIIHLVGISVVPEARGTGVGSSLMARFEAEAARRGARELRLSVYATNREARHLYEKRGWSIVEGSSGGRVLVYALALGGERTVDPG